MGSMRLIALMLFPILLMGAHAALKPHPRIWLNSDHLTDIKLKVATGDPSWTALKSSVETRLAACLASSTSPSGLLTLSGQAPNFALAYAVAASMSSSERSSYGLQNYANWARCAIRLSVLSVAYYSANRSKTFTGDGTTTIFTLDNTILYRPYFIRTVIDGIVSTYDETKIGEYGVDSNKAWYWERDTRNIRQDPTADPLGSSDTLQVVYEGQPESCISGVYGNPVANDGTYGYGTYPFTATSNIECTYRALPGTVGATGLNEFRNNGWILATIFDWCYDQLTDSEKSYLVAGMRSAAWYQAALSDYRPYLLGQGQGPGGNLNAGQISRVGLIGLATYGDNPTDTDQGNYEINKALGWMTGYAVPYFNGTPNYPDLDSCQRYTDNCRADVTKNSYTALAGEGVGGAMPEGPEYGPQAAAYLLQLIEAFTTSGLASADLYSPMPSFVSDNANWLLHNTAPAASPQPQPLIWGDVQNWSFSLTESDRIKSLFLSNALGSSTLGKYVRSWYGYTQLTVPPYEYLRVFDTLYRSQSWTSLDYRAADITKDYLSNGQALVVSRSSWDADATWFGFFAGSRWANHQHADAGGFSVFRKGQWLLLEDYGYGVKPFIPELLHNVLSYNLDGESLSHGPLVVNALGRAPIRIFKPDASNRYTYLRTTLTDVYRGGSIPGNLTNVQAYTRDVVYFKPDYFVLLDRVHYAARTVSTFNMLGKRVWDGSSPNFSSNRAELPLGSQKAVLTVLEPSSPNLGAVDNNTDNTYTFNSQTSSSYVFQNKIGRLSGVGLPDASTMSFTITEYVNDGTFTYPHVLTIESEKLQVCSCSASTGVMTVCANGRGYNQTTAAAHAAGTILSGFWSNWRVTSKKTTEADTDDLLLHVIETADSGTTPANAVKLTTVSDTHVGVLVETSPPRLALLPRLDAAYAEVSFSAAYSGSAQIVVTGLSPGVYRVRRDGFELADYRSLTVAEDGVLYLESTQGAFVIDVAPPSADAVVTGSTSQKVVLRYGQTGMAAGTSCSVSTSASPSLTPLVDGGTFTETGGASRREHVIGAGFALSPLTSYYYRVLCGSLAAVGEFATPAANSRSGAVTLSLHPPAGRSVASVQVDYGTSPALGQTLTESCPSGCSLSLPLSLPTMLYYRYRYQDAALQQLSASSLHVVAAN